MAQTKYTRNHSKTLPNPHNSSTSVLFALQHLKHQQHHLSAFYWFWRPPSWPVSLKASALFVLGEQRPLLVLGLKAIQLISLNCKMQWCCVWWRRCFLVNIQTSGCLCGFIDAKNAAERRLSTCGEVWRSLHSADYKMKWSGKWWMFGEKEEREVEDKEEEEEEGRRKISV